MLLEYLFAVQFVLVSHRACLLYTHLVHVHDLSPYDQAVKLCNYIKYEPIKTSYKCRSCMSLNHSPVHCSLHVTIVLSLVNM